MQKTFELAVDVCCCLETCNSVVNMKMMGDKVGWSYLP